MKMAMWARKALAMFCFMMLLGGVGTLDKANADSILPDGTFLNPIGTGLNLTPWSDFSNMGITRVDAPGSIPGNYANLPSGADLFQRFAPLANGNYQLSFLIQNQSPVTAHFWIAFQQQGGYDLATLIQLGLAEDLILPGSSPFIRRYLDFTVSNPGFPVNEFTFSNSYGMPINDSNPPIVVNIADVTFTGCFPVCSRIDPKTVTLTEAPGNIVQGGTATATWSAIAAPTNRDWIGLYAPSAVDTTFIDWIYVSCSKSAGAAPASGSCPFLIPSSLPNGSYQLRLFTNNGYTRLATSNSFNVAPVPPPSLRFVDNNDGTVTDDQTGLQWEKKTACTGPSATDIHCVNNTYRWSSTLPSPDGTLFTDFLARINKVFSTSGDGITVADVCFAGYCDWRVPNIAELRTIVLAACPGGGSPCIDPIFGPTSTGYYWSSTTNDGSPSLAWGVNFGGGFVLNGSKIGNVDVRAVRGGL